MTSNETYHTLDQIIAVLEKALHNDNKLSTRNKQKPLNFAVDYSIAKLKQAQEGQLPNDNSR